MKQGDIQYQITESGQPDRNLVLTQDGRVLRLPPQLFAECVIPPGETEVRLTHTFRFSGLESKAIEEIGDYLNRAFVDKFPVKMDPDLEILMKEVMFDVFHDGMTFAEELNIGRRKAGGKIHLLTE